MVSFSKLVKDELLNIECTDLKVKLAAVIFSASTASFSNDNIILEIRSSNISLIRDVLKTFKTLYKGFSEQVIIRENKQFKSKNKVYIIKIENDSKKILKDLGLIKGDVGLFINYDIPDYILEEENIHTFLRYLFICSGSINNPKIQKQYHLEIILNNNSVLTLVQNVSSKYDINFKMTTRRNISALYLNKSEEIADFLRLIGSLDYMFEFENQRMLRDIRAAENRLINAEIANETKKQEASNEQIKSINLLKEKKVFNDLKEKTKLVAGLREENPSASLNDLYLISDKTISKSNFRHHLNLIIKEANKYEEEHEN